MCATIEAGRPTANGTNPHEAHLKTVYITMNYYYQRARAAISGLQKDERNLALALRFVFLLAEFLRQYRWEPISKSKTLCAAQTGANVPNHLALGEGIVENFYNLLSSLLSSCTDAQKPRAMSIAVRGVGSLAIQHPTKYLRKCEPIIRTALGSSDAGTQVQGLTAIRDFLVDEELRVAAASGKQTTSAATPGLSSKTTKKSEEDSDAESEDMLDSPKKGKKEKAAKKEKKDKSSKKKGKEEPLPDAEDDGADALKASSLVAAIDGNVDHNSGMSTWLLQRFGADVMALSCSPVHQVRSLVVDTLTLAVYQGLLSPVIYVESLVILSSYESPHRMKAQNCLAYIHDRHEDAVGPSRLVAGVAASFKVHVAIANAAAAAVALHAQHQQAVSNRSISPQRQLAANPYNFATYEPSSDRAPTMSLHSELFRLLHKAKKPREAFVLGILRLLHQDARILEWQQRCPSMDWAAKWGPKYMIYLAHSVAFLPFVKEADVLLLLSHIDTAIDLHGESVIDFLDAESQLQQNNSSNSPAKTKSKAPPMKKAKSAKKEADTEPKSKSESPRKAQWPMDSESAQNRGTSWLKTVGLAMCLLLKRFIRKEYGITPAKLLRRMEKQHGTNNNGPSLGAGTSSGSNLNNATLPHREPDSGATKDFIKKTETVVELAAGFVGDAGYTQVNTTSEGVRLLAEMRELVGDLIEEDSAEAMAVIGGGAGKTSRANSPARGAKPKRRITTKAATKGKVGRKRARADSDGESDDDSSSDDSSFPSSSSSSAQEE